MNKKHERELLKRGFEKQFTEDLTDFWLEKPFTLGFIEGIYVKTSENSFIDVWIIDEDDGKKMRRMVWEGCYKSFIQLMNRYNSK